MPYGSGLGYLRATLEVERCAPGVARSHIMSVSRIINDLLATHH
jgi:hypothetical protein